MIVLTIIVLVVALAVVSACWSGYVLSVLWGWFIVPLFHLPALTVSQAIGLSLVVAMFKTLPQDSKDGDTESQISRMIQILLVPLLALGIGWIVKGFLPV